jgi:hypothetical protein
MQAPFEADAHMKVKALIDEGKISAPISEDGDLVFMECHAFGRRLKSIQRESQKEYMTILQVG